MLVFVHLWACRFNSGLVFGVVAMLGSVLLLIKTLQQTLAQMTTNNPRIGGQQALQVVVCTHQSGHLGASMFPCSSQPENVLQSFVVQAQNRLFISEHKYLNSHKKPVILKHEAEKCPGL